jgi:dihydroorotase
VRSGRCFDLIVAGGRVVDPAGAGVLDADVGVRDGRIAAVAPALERVGAAIADAAGLLVVPGLVDLHTHVVPRFTYWGVDPDPLAARSGVTTWVDAGSAGAYGIDGLRHDVAARCTARVRAFLNISSIGLAAPSFELANRAYLDEGLCAEMAARHAGFVVGIKARIDRFTVGALDLEPLHAALRAAERAHLPLMVHIAHGPPEVERVLDELRPGDIVTHCATPASMALVRDGRVLDAALRAVRRGVVLDLGHGSGGFSFAAAEALLEAGAGPAVISSDAHQLSVNGPMFDLPTCLTKLLALGMPLEATIEAATTTPASLIGEADELGTLTPGACADIALLALEDGPFPVYDVLEQRRNAAHRLRAVRTFVAGEELAPSALPLPAPWVPLSAPQAELRAASARGETPDLASSLSDPATRARPPLLGPQP